MSAELRSDVRFRKVFGEGLIIRQDAAEVLGLNPTGARIVELVGTGAPETEIVAALCQEFEVDEAQARDDLRRFIDELAEAGVVVRE
jgi:hypothetical protein